MHRSQAVREDHARGRCAVAVGWFTGLQKQDTTQIHVRFGKGSRGRGPKTRLVPAINSAGTLREIDPAAPAGWAGPAHRG
jgi:hypothetical protein